MQRAFPAATLNFSFCPTRLLRCRLGGHSNKCAERGIKLLNPLQTRGGQLDRRYRPAAHKFGGVRQAEFREFGGYAGHARDKCKWCENSRCRTHQITPKLATQASKSWYDGAL